MRIIFFSLIVILLSSSCKSAHNPYGISKKNKPYHSYTRADKIINYAKKFLGVKYKYGGTTRKGMDCSGLIQTAYKSESIQLPRTTGNLVKTGSWIPIKNIKKGDLLFFATSKNSRKVNHVGIVTTITDTNVSFLHASSSKGVMISNLSQRYWYFAFVQARRVL